jgi:hypothetical protein
VPEPYSPSKNPLALAVAAALETYCDRSAGGAMLDISTSFCWGSDFVQATPSHRQRLDHYGTSYEDDGREVEGWDSEGWENDYCAPMRNAVREHLKKNNIDVSKLQIEVGEKGHLEIFVS